MRGRTVLELMSWISLPIAIMDLIEGDPFSAYCIVALGVLIGRIR
jgi:hypothetical protein